MTAKIKVENISKIFGSHPKQALRKLEAGSNKEEILKETGQTVGVNQASFHVNQGEIFVIMGLSGSGKSTLIRCLNLLIKPTKGKIYVDGENIVDYDSKQLMKFRQEKVAMVFQHFGLFTHKTVLNNVEYGLEIRGVEKKKRQEIAKSTLKTVGLAGWEEKYPNELSGGMQQRVGLARALANDPDILLMDEPFSALDPLIRREMHYELLDIQAKLKKTIIFITHDVNEAFNIGDRVAVMKDGIIEQIGTPEEILDAPSSDYIKEFVKDIDRSKVLQAKHVMYKPTTTVTLDAGAKGAVQKMEAHEIASVFVIDQNRKLLGLVTIDDAMQAVETDQSLREILRTEYETTAPDTHLQKLIEPASKSKYPIAVIDQQQRLKGIVVRSSVLAGLVSV